MVMTKQFLNLFLDLVYMWEILPVFLLNLMILLFIV